MRQNPAIHINLSSSPFWHSKREVRRQMLAAIARRDGIPVLMCNQVGGNDSLIFDGSSMAINARGELVAQAHRSKKIWCSSILSMRPQFQSRLKTTQKPPIAPLCSARATTCASADSSKVLIALSGGIDSALVAAIAADALGKENVLGIGMPSPYSSQGSIDDSRKLAANLGIRFEIIGISDLFKEFTQRTRAAVRGTWLPISPKRIFSRAFAALC